VDNFINFTSFKSVILALEKCHTLQAFQVLQI